jgi:ornithine cyclodeaminase
VRIVSAEHLRQLVPMSEAIDAVEAAFVSMTEGDGGQPRRLVSEDGTALAMVARPSHAGMPLGGTSMKLITVWEPNRARNLPTVHAVALWFDGESQRPEVLIEGAALTALRTGAATGVATRLLARPQSSTLAIIGAGGQAADQVRGVCAVRPIEEVVVFSRGASAELLVERLGPEFPDVRVRRAASAAEAVEDADVVCCATTSRLPVIPHDVIGPRTHVNAIGAYRPDMREVPSELFARAEIVAVDSLEAALAEAGDLIAAIADGAIADDAPVELGTLVKRPPRPPKSPTIFKSVGVAMQDWAICSLVSERVDERTLSVDLLDAS